MSEGVHSDCGRDRKLSSSASLPFHTKPSAPAEPEDEDAEGHVGGGGVVELHHVSVLCAVRLGSAAQGDALDER